SAAQVKPDQRSMSGFEQRIQCQESLSNGDAAIEAAGMCVLAHKLQEGMHGKLVEAAPLDRHPLLETFFPQAEAGQQLASIQSNRLFQGLRSAVRRQALESQSIDVNHPGVQPDRLRVAVDQLVRARDGSAYAGKGLAQARTRLLLGAAIPERGRQVL